jgi:hypothetical protein
MPGQRPAVRIGTAGHHARAEGELTTGLRGRAAAKRRFSP